MTMTLYKNEELGCDIIIFGEDMDTVILVNGEVRSVEEWSRDDDDDYLGRNPGDVFQFCLVRWELVEGVSWRYGFTYITKGIPLTFV